MIAEFTSRAQASAAWQQLLAGEPTAETERLAYWEHAGEQVDRIYTFLRQSEPDAPTQVTMLRTRLNYFPRRFEVNGQTLDVAGVQRTDRVGQTLIFRIHCAGEDHSRVLEHDLQSGEWREVAA